MQGKTKLLSPNTPMPEWWKSLTQVSSPFKSFSIALKNKPFVRLCIIYFSLNISFAFCKILMVYFVQYQLNMEKMSRLPWD